MFTSYGTAWTCILELSIQVLMNFNAHMSGSIIIVIALDRYLSLDPDLKRVNGLGGWITATCGFRISMDIRVFLSVITSAVATIEFKDRRIPDSISAVVDIILFLVTCILYHCLYRNVKIFTKRGQNLKFYSNQLNRPFYFI